MLDQLHEANHWQNVYVPPDGKGCVGCDTGNILRCQECSPNLRTQDATLADEARRSGSHGILHEMFGLWQELDFSRKEEWERTGDNVRFKKKMENERVFEFLARLNHKLDNVRSRVLSCRPLPSI
ncbi:hypothetical protein CK203_087046 [Vitis vinifera]|uniref:Uncharacterized protein n=1 Tax=Vitis vinifera TaxID=29760 RepID=A0A438CLT7_VITVI|nr:hypothetical protein CK203_087046 [Vitis vinifera]